MRFTTKNKIKNIVLKTWFLCFYFCVLCCKKLYLTINIKVKAWQHKHTQNKHTSPKKKKEKKEGVIYGIASNERDEGGVL